MKANWSFLLIFLCSSTTAQHDVCPPWFVPDNKSSTGCSCHSSHMEVICGVDFPLLHLGYCMTYNNTTGITEYGPCPYIAHYNITTSSDQVFYIQLPSNVSSLNEFMCGPLNREGPLCEKCKNGYGIALYSYTLECSKCWGHGYGWVLYYFLELFPITVMYFLVVIFHIRATSSPLSALVFMSQIIVYTIRLNVPLHMYIENKVTGFPYVALQLLLVVCSIWSLDFFRAVIPPFCASSNIKTVHALALEYLVAFYPICLIVVTYICIKLHDNNFRPVVWLWKPFHRHFVHFRRRWDSTASIINAFTTFLLLSFSKILFVSFTLLYSFPIKYNFDISGTYVLYYDTTVIYNTPEYSIFAAIAGCVLAIFIISPTIILILYPTRLFRKCVSCCGFRRWHALHMFVESFQGQYKDGTNGTRDYRVVSASFLILRILAMATFLNRHYSYYTSSGTQCFLFASTSCFYALVRPYKLNFRNNVDIFILFMLATFSEILLIATFHPASEAPFTYYALGTGLVLCIPHVVLVFYICYVLATKAGITLCLQRKYKILKRCLQATQHESQVERDVEADGLLPDRLINPGEYEPVLLTTGEHTAAESTGNKEEVSEDQRKLTPVYTYGSIS